MKTSNNPLLNIEDRYDVGGGWFFNFYWYYVMWIIPKYIMAFVEDEIEVNFLKNFMHDFFSIMIFQEEKTIHNSNTMSSSSIHEPSWKLN